MPLEMAHKVILPPKKNYIPQFLKQRDVNSYFHRNMTTERKLTEIIQNSADYWELTSVHLAISVVIGYSLACLLAYSWKVEG
jgi:hypothetical protein